MVGVKSPVNEIVREVFAIEKSTTLAVDTNVPKPATVSPIVSEDWVGAVIEKFDHERPLVRFCAKLPVPLVKVTFWAPLADAKVPPDEGFNVKLYAPDPVRYPA